MWKKKSELQNKKNEQRLIEPEKKQANRIEVREEWIKGGRECIK